MSALDSLIKCQAEGCQEGHFCYGYHEETDEYDWGACSCCGGAGFEHCPTCTINALRSRIAELEALTTWWPIETCPRNAAVILAAAIYPDSQEITMVYSDNEFIYYETGEVFTGATHWMPLPKPPEAE
jgi:hypothetical protein